MLMCTNSDLDVMIAKDRLTCQHQFLQSLHNLLDNADDLSMQHITSISTVLMACHSLSYPCLAFQDSDAVLTFDTTTLFHESDESCWTQWIGENQKIYDSVHKSVILLNQWMSKKTLMNLTKQNADTVHFTRYELASILALSLFGRIFQEKLKFIASYFIYLENIKYGYNPDNLLPSRMFQYITNKTNHCAADQLNIFRCLMEERVTVTRVVGIAIDDFNDTENSISYKDSASLEEMCTIWSQCDFPLVSFIVHYNKLIQDCQGFLQADFASHKIGGGTLRSGSAQEEIFFLTHPEAIAISFLTESLCKNEAIIIKGVNRYVDHKGYSSHLTCLGPVHWHEKLQTDNLAPFRCSLTPTIIVAVDAIHYKSKKHSFDQYKKSHFMRDLQKLYSALEQNITDNDLKEERTPFASGHWGCGVFRGDIQLKSIIQWLAASRSKRQLNYCITGSIQNFLSETDIVFLSTTYPTVGSLFNAVLSILDNASFTTTPFIWNLLTKGKSVDI